jgi:hypothetical protein
VQQSNASTSNHATRRTHSQDTTATHHSGKLVNYKRLACYEHCPGTFGYTFIYIHIYIYILHIVCMGTHTQILHHIIYSTILIFTLESVVFNENVVSLRFPSSHCNLTLFVHPICHPYLWLSHCRYCSRPCRLTASINTFSAISISLNCYIYIYFFF